MLIILLMLISRRAVHRLHSPICTSASSPNGHLTACTSATIMGQSPLSMLYPGRKRKPLTLPQSLSTEPESHSSPDVIADYIRSSGMADLVAVLLQTFKPLAWVGGQMLWMLQPFIEGPGLGRHSPLSTAGLARLLEREHGVDEIVDRLRSRGEDLLPDDRR